MSDKLAFAFSETKTASVCPSRTETRVQVQETFIGCGAT